MTDARWAQVKALFEAAVERPPSERAAFLAAVTGDNESLRAKVESLLRSDDPDAALTNLIQPQGASLTGVSGTSPDVSSDETQTALNLWTSIGTYRVVGLKPANIRVTPEGIVKVLDFGLAKTVVGDRPLAKPPSRRRPLTGAHASEPSSAPPRT